MNTVLGSTSALLGAALIWLMAGTITEASSFAAGQAAFHRGDFVEAAGHWEEAARQSAQTRDGAGQVEAWVRLATAQQALGRNRAAVTTLEQALAVAERLPDRRLLLLVKSNVGGVCSCIRQRTWAEKLLREAAELATELKDDNAAALVWSSLGNSLALQGKRTEALAAYEKSAQLAQRPALRVTALVNGAAVAGTAEWDRRARAAVPTLDRSHEQARLWLRCAETEIRLANEPVAEASARSALAIGEELADPRLRSYACGLGLTRFFVHPVVVLMIFS